MLRCLQGATAAVRVCPWCCTNHESARDFRQASQSQHVIEGWLSDSGSRDEPTFASYGGSRFSSPRCSSRRQHRKQCCPNEVSLGHRIWILLGGQQYTYSGILSIRDFLSVSHNSNNHKRVTADPAPLSLNAAAATTAAAAAATPSAANGLTY